MILAIPKSVSCGSPYSVSRMFAGLTSRCRCLASVRGFQRAREFHADV